MRKGGFAYSGNVFDQQVPTGDQCDYRKSDCFRLAFYDGFYSLLQPLDLLDRIRAGYLLVSD
jgi:hypothetical protein